MRRLALETNMSFIRQLGYGYGAHGYTPEELEAARGVYDSCIRELDHFTGNLLTALESRGQLDNTIVVITSDHGESLGEHRQFGHRTDIYQTLLHVPLVVHYPRRLTAGRVAEPVTTQDLFGSLVDLAGLELPAAAAETRPWSIGARKHLFSENRSYDFKGLALARKTFPQIPETGWDHTYRSIREGAHKLLVDETGHAELYDLSIDPGEQSDLMEVAPELARRLKEAIDARWSTLRKYDPAEREGDDVPVIGAKEAEMLEVLGYITDEEL